MVSSRATSDQDRHLRLKGWRFSISLSLPFEFRSYANCTFTRTRYVIHALHASADQQSVLLQKRRTAPQSGRPVSWGMENAYRDATHGCSQNGVPKRVLKLTKWKNKAGMI